MKHFRFGENWDNFSNLIDENRLEQAVISLKKLSNKKNFNNLSFWILVVGRACHLLPP